MEVAEKQVIVGRRWSAGCAPRCGVPNRRCSGRTACPARVSRSNWRRARSCRIPLRVGSRYLNTLPLRGAECDGHGQPLIVVEPDKVMAIFKKRFQDDIGEAQFFRLGSGLLA